MRSSGPVGSKIFDGRSGADQWRGIHCLPEELWRVGHEFLYVQYLRAQAPVGGSPEIQHPNVFSGVLVGHHLSEIGQRWAGTAANEGILVRTWAEFLDVAERTHRDFLNIITERAPEDVRVRRIIESEDAG